MSIFLMRAPPSAVEPSGTAGAARAHRSVDEAGLVLADEVQVELVPALVEVLLKPVSVLGEVARDSHGLFDPLGGDGLADDVECLDGLDVPGHRRGEDVVAPLVVGNGQGLLVRGCPAEVDLQAGRASAPGLAVGAQNFLQRLPATG